MARNNARSTESPSAPAAAPPPPTPDERIYSAYARRAVTGTLGSIRAAQSAALTRYAAWILDLETATTRSLASLEQFLLGALRLATPAPEPPTPAT